MRVWVVGRGLPTKSNGMLGSFELEQAQMLAKAGLDVCYFGISVRSAKNLHKIGYFQDRIDNVFVYSYNFPFGRVLSTEYTDKIFERSFKNLAAKAIQLNGAPDIIHVHYPAQRPYSAFARYQTAGVKIVATEHWTKVQNKTIGKKNIENIKQFCHKCDSLICVGSSLVTAIREITGTKKNIAVVPNVVNSNFICEPMEHEGIRFVAAGRLVHHKQFDKIAEAFVTQFSNADDAFLTIAGNGEDYKKIEQLIKHSRMSNRVKLPGTLTREEMATVMASSDVLISYSKLETFCVPVIEAWMSGMPVIVSSISPVALDYNDAKLGIFVDCDDIITLKHAMKQMYKYSKQYDKCWISKFARANFSESAVANKLIGIYNSLV